MRSEFAILGESLPLSGHRVVTTARDDEAADIISHFLLPLRIVKVAERRRFRLDMNGQRLERLSIGFNQFATDTEVETEAVEDTVCLGLGYDARHPSYFEIDDERIRISTKTAAVISPSLRARIWRPSKSGMFVLGISASVLADRYEEITGAPVRGPIKIKPSADLTKGPGRQLRELTHALATEIEHEELGSKSTLLRSVLEDALISVVLGLPGNHHRGPEVEPRPGIAPWMVRRVEEYIAAHAADPITLSDLIAVSGRSSSTLYQAFKSSRGYTPMQFLASRRLELARKRLMREPGATATKIALHYGFSNHGRFAKAYRSRYGESPATTQARSHERKSR